MTLSTRDRSQNCSDAVILMLQQLGDGAIDESLFEPTGDPFRDVLPTTWAELERDGWVEQIRETQQYRFTGLGWLQAVKLAGKLDDDSLLTRAGRLFAAMKDHVKGRQKPFIAKLSELSQTARVPEGLVFNIIESNILEKHFGRRGAVWHERGRLILIPIDFNVEPADVRMFFKEEMLNRIEELQAELAQAREELTAYKCPHCGAPLETIAPVELDEHTWDTVEVFACGHSTGGWREAPCPSDPRFPKLDEFEFKIIKSEGQWGIQYVCIALAKTDMARRVDLNQGVGRTEEEAKQIVIEHYNRRAKPWQH